MKSVFLGVLGVPLAVVCASPVYAEGAAHPPAPRDIGSWLRESYPASALVAHAEGRTAFVLTILPNGKPSDCRITESSGHADLDEATCDLFRKGRFNAAVDENGTKVVGEWPSVMRWVLPR